MFIDISQQYRRGHSHIPFIVSREGAVGEGGGGGGGAWLNSIEQRDTGSYEKEKERAVFNRKKKKKGWDEKKKKARYK
jgi:hypothetical protein